MANETKTINSFELKCPRCNAESSITLDLNDLKGEMLCHDCEETFTVDQAVQEATVASETWKAAAKRWEAVASWISVADRFIDDKN